MNDEQYKNLMWHLLYVEGLLENAAEEIGGGGCECPLCKAKFPAYRPSKKSLIPKSICPNCNSLPRHRALRLLIEKLNWYHKGMRVLHFAPESMFYKLFSSFKDIDYWPVDFNPKVFGIRKVVDITEIPFDDDSFDLIMCTHVLEHIPDDRKAMRELYRVLKPRTGIALLNVPIWREHTLENHEYNTPELRTKYYGQVDHVRMYGLDYPQRLNEAGFEVQEFKLNELPKEDVKRYGLLKIEKLFWCRKE